MKVCGSWYDAYMNEGAPRFQRPESREANSLDEHERQVIEELEFPVQRILQQIQPELMKGAYSLIIGDDVSGRIPAIIMNEAVRKIYKAYGHPAPMLRFVAGGRRAEEETPSQERSRQLEMRDRMASMNNELLRSGDAPRALLVTEAIMTGDAMELVVCTLERERIKTDIAAIAFIGDQAEEPVTLADVQRKLKSARIIVGSDRRPGVYGMGKRYMQGVGKDNGSATASRFTDYLIHAEERAFTQAKVNATRVLATKVGSDVADVYLAGKLEQAA